MVTNIDVNEIIAQKVEKDNAIKEQQEKKKQLEKVEFNVNNYLDTRLGPNENEKTLTIRLLPFSATELSPFKKIKVHSVKMKNDKGQKVWKKFMCPVGMGKDDKCPFCEMSEKARILKYNETNEATRKDYGDIEFMNMAKDYWLVRCIDRAHEDHGVKFWRFPDSKKGEGVFDKIISLIKTRQAKGKDIVDLYKGKDLIITVTKSKASNGKETMVYNITDDDEIKPLHEDETVMEKWVNDPKRWEDVYSIKSYEYMDIVVQGEYPVWSKTLNRWIAKADADKIAVEAREQQVKENLMPQTQDFSTFTVNTGSTRTEMSIEANGNTQPSNPIDDDLPF